MAEHAGYLLCTRGYNTLCDPTRRHEVWRIIIVGCAYYTSITRRAGLKRAQRWHADPIQRLTALVLAVKTKLNYSMYQNKFDTKMKWNYTANMIMIMSISVTVCHLILYLSWVYGMVKALGRPALYQTFSTNHISYTKTLVPIYIFRGITFFWWCRHFFSKNGLFAKKTLCHELFFEKP